MFHEKIVLIAGFFKMRPIDWYNVISSNKQKIIVSLLTVLSVQPGMKLKMSLLITLFLALLCQHTNVVCIPVVCVDMRNDNADKGWDGGLG